MQNAGLVWTEVTETLLNFYKSLINIHYILPTQYITQLLRCNSESSIPVFLELVHGEFESLIKLNFFSSVNNRSYKKNLVVHLLYYLMCNIL